MEAFKKLIVWQKAMELVRVVYRISKGFPPDERYALTDQLRRAAVSIPSNIAEGNGRVSNKDYAHFLAMARGSLFETLTQIQVAEDLGYIGEHEEFDNLAADVGRMLTSLLRKYGAIHSTATAPRYT